MKMFLSLTLACCLGLIMSIPPAHAGTSAAGSGNASAIGSPGIGTPPSTGKCDALAIKLKVAHSAAELSSAEVRQISKKYVNVYTKDQLASYMKTVSALDKKFLNAVSALYSARANYNACMGNNPGDGLGRPN